MPGSRISKSWVPTRSVSILKCPPPIYGNASGGTGPSCPKNTGKRSAMPVLPTNPSVPGLSSGWITNRTSIMTMEAVPNHHRKTPEFKTLKIVYVPDNSTRLAMLQAGEADIIVLAGPHIPQIKADPSLKLVQIKHIIGTDPGLLPISPSRKKKVPFRISGFVKRPAWPLTARGSATRCSLAGPNLMAR